MTDWLKFIWSCLIRKAHAQNECKPPSAFGLPTTSAAPQKSENACNVSSTLYQSAYVIHRAAYLPHLKRHPMKSDETGADNCVSYPVGELTSSDKAVVTSSPVYVANTSSTDQDCYEVNDTEVEQLQWPPISDETELLDIDFGDLSSLITLDDFINNICQMCATKADMLFYRPCCGCLVCAVCWTSACFCGSQHAVCLICSKAHVAPSYLCEIERVM